jgi:sterol desaturase/sphingolipid hydroxylase (fatty acid hydroxylase superfamily)
MRPLPSLISRVHWAHLLLLAALPLWLQRTVALDAALRIGGWVVIGFLLLGLAERLHPHRRDWHPGGRHLRRDGSVLALNAVFDAAASAALAVLAIHALPGTSTLPLWLQIAGGIVVAEFASYWLHRISHRGGWLWRVHLLHHRPEQLNVANALTAHPLNALYDKLARLAPLVLLGASPEAVIAVTAFTLTQSLVTHANVAGGIGPLVYLIGGAQLHRLHHGVRLDQAGNFGTTIPLWDQLFGTFRLAAAPERVGVFEPARYPSEFELVALLRLPFAPCRLCALGRGGVAAMLRRVGRGERNGRGSSAE